MDIKLQKTCRDTGLSGKQIRYDQHQATCVWVRCASSVERSLRREGKVPQAERRLERRSERRSRNRFSGSKCVCRFEREKKQVSLCSAEILPPPRIQGYGTTTKPFEPFLSQFCSQFCSQFLSPFRQRGLTLTPWVKKKKRLQSGMADLVDRFAAAVDPYIYMNVSN